MNIGAPELLIVLLIVLVLFGAGRVSRLGGDLGTAIREFRKGLAGDEPTDSKPDTTAATPDTTESNDSNSKPS